MAAPITAQKTIRAAMYLRQSEDKTGDEVKVGDQRKDLTQLCQQRGWTWTEYEDNDFSASVRMPGSKKAAKRRPAYEDMIADIKAGKIDAVVVRTAERLYRHPRELEDLIDLADNRGLELATVAGKYDLGTPEGRLLARMLGSVGRHEMELKSVRQKRANQQRLEDEGGPWWPSRPFGYTADLDRETGKWWTVKRIKGQPPRFNPIRKHSTEAALVEDAYRKFLAGSKLRSMAAAWNREGIKTPRGNPWNGSQLRALLMAARNAGLREHDGKVVGKGTWPAIVSEEVWEMAVRELSKPERRNGATRGRKHLLSGIARCGRPECGKPLGSTISTRKIRQYVCIHCQRVSRDAGRVDELIIELVVRRLSRPDAVDLLRPPVTEVDAEALRQERRSLKDKLVQLGKDFASAPPEFTQAALAEINDRLAEIDAQLTDPGKARIFEDVIGAKDVQKAFNSLDLGRRRTIVDALMTIAIKPVSRGSKVFDPDAIDVAWK